MSVYFYVLSILCARNITQLHNMFDSIEVKRLAKAAEQNKLKSRMATIDQKMGRFCDKDEEAKRSKERINECLKVEKHSDVRKYFEGQIESINKNRSAYTKIINDLQAERDGLRRKLNES